MYYFDLLNLSLVGGLEHVFISHHIWDVILPIDELIFFNMVIAPPTRSCMAIFKHALLLAMHKALWFLSEFHLPPASRADMFLEGRQCQKSGNFIGEWWKNAGKMVWKWWKMGDRSCVSLFVDLTVAKPSGKRLQKTMENGHRNSGYSHWTWWFFIVFCKRLPEGILCWTICSPELFLNIISHHYLQRSWNKIRKNNETIYYFCEVRSLSETALAMKTNSNQQIWLTNYG